MVDAWLSAHAGWERVGDRAPSRGASRLPRFFSAALGFTVRVGLPRGEEGPPPGPGGLGWGKARVLWSTHDAGGITRLDLDSAEGRPDKLAG